MQRLFRDDEEIIWTKKPHKKAFYVGSIIATLLVLGFLGVFFGFWVAPILIPVGLVLADIVLGGAGTAATLVAVVVLGGLGIFGSLPLAFVVSHFRYKHAEYALTDDRVIANSGLIGRDSSTVSLGDVRDVDTKVGILDKIFDTGQLKVQVAGGQRSGVVLYYLEAPYDILDTFEQARKEAVEGGSG
jgi:uncharacterized membrane protein YdbT with pleckstrin-like domain